MPVENAPEAMDVAVPAVDFWDRRENDSGN